MVFVIEVFLRIFLTERSSGMNMGILNKKFSKKYYATNKEGYRDVEYFKKNTEKDFIIFLGDSFTFGSGVAQDKIFPSIILKKNDKYEILNLGVPGTNTLDHYNLYKKNIKKVKDSNIDFLIYQYFVNDIDYLIKKRPKFSKFETFLVNKMKKSYLVDYIYTPFLLKKFGKNYMDEIFKSYENVNFEIHLNDINKIFKKSHENNIKVVMLPFPFLNNKKALIFSERYINKLEDFFKTNCNNGDAYLRINSIVMTISEDKWTVNKFDAHPSETLHSIISEKILMSLEKNKDDSIIYCN